MPTSALRNKGVHPGGEGGGNASLQYFLRRDDNAFVTPILEEISYAIAIKHSMSGDGWQRR